MITPPAPADPAPTLETTESSVATVWRTLFLVALIGVVTALVQPFLISLVTGWIFGTALLPLFNGPLTRIRSIKARSLALVLGFFVACMLPAGSAIYFGVSEIANQARESNIEIKALDGSQSPRQTEVQLQRWLEAHPSVSSVAQSMGFDSSRLVKTASANIGKVREKILALATAVLTGIPDLVVSTVILLLTMYFFFIDHPRIHGWCASLSAYTPEETQKIGKTFSDTCNSVVIASVISGLVQSTIVSLGSFLAGFGQPLLIGLITFFSSFLPLFGTGAVTVVLLLFALLSGDWAAFAILAGAGALAAISDNLTAPLVVGSRAKVHPLVTFVAALGGVQVLGFFGLFIGPVLTATLLRSIQVMSRHRHAKIALS